MNKFYLVLFFLCLNLTGIAQNKDKKFLECIAISRTNDTIQLKVFNVDKKGKLLSYYLSKGFNGYNAIDGKKRIISPDNYSHVIVKDSIHGDMKFKAVDRTSVEGKKPKYFFMNYIKEYPRSEYSSGKINVYGHLYSSASPNGYFEKIITIYVEDSSGFRSMIGRRNRVKYIGQEGNQIFKNLRIGLKLLFFTNNAKLPELEKEN